MILITGAAGFIGFHLAMRLHALRDDLVLVDDLSNEHRNETLERKGILESNGLRVLEASVSSLKYIVEPDVTKGLSAVVHLAALPGVRKGPEHYREYLQRNIMATQSVLEFCRVNNVPHLLYASSSSVYGNITMSEQEDRAPRSIYAATKKADEAMAGVYSRIHGLCCTGMRFFTVYGAHGRPDMAYYKFLNAMLRGEEITVHRGMMRDMTHVSDVVSAIVRLMASPRSGPVNIGTGEWHSVEEMVAILERASGTKARITYQPAHPADMRWSLADNSVMRGLGWRPEILLEEGMTRFAQWHRENVQA